MKKPSATFLRFALVGGVNTLLGVSVFPILYKILWDRVEMNLLLALSYAICTLSAFMLHKFVTFGVHGRAHRQGVRFLLVTGALLLLNMALLNLIVRCMPGADPALVQPVIAVLLQLGNYGALKTFVFARSPAKKGEITRESSK